MIFLVQIHNYTMALIGIPGFSMTNLLLEKENLQLQTQKQDIFNLLYINVLWGQPRPK